MLVWILRGVRPLYAAGILHTQRFTAVMSVVFGTAIAGLLIGAFGPWPEFAAGMYVGTLFLGLFMCSYYFFMLISAIQLEQGH